MKRFQAEPVPVEVVQAVLEDTRRSPSSFNVQPWKCVIVRNDGGRDALASAMVSGNKARVREAPLTAVFLADLGSSTRCFPDYVAHTPVFTRFCAGSAPGGNGQSPIASSLTWSGWNALPALLKTTSGRFPPQVRQTAPLCPFSAERPPSGGADSACGAVGLLASGGRLGAAANCAFSQLAPAFGGLPTINDSQVRATVPAFPCCGPGPRS